jgi:hypothetical protein
MPGGCALADAGPDAGGADAGPCPLAGTATVILATVPCAVVLGGRLPKQCRGRSARRRDGPNPPAADRGSLRPWTTAGVFTYALGRGRRRCAGQVAFGQLGMDTAGASPTLLPVGGV